MVEWIEIDFSFWKCFWLCHIEQDAFQGKHSFYNSVKHMYQSWKGLFGRCHSSWERGWLTSGSWLWKTYGFYFSLFNTTVRKTNLVFNSAFKITSCLSSNEESQRAKEHGSNHILSIPVNLHGSEECFSTPIFHNPRVKKWNKMDVEADSCIWGKYNFQQ